MSLIISIDGNSKCGRTTLINELENEIKKLNIKNIIFIKEPLEELTGINDESVEKLFYENPNNYAFVFLMFKFISKLKLLKKIIKENNNAIIITKGSLHTDKHILAKMLYENMNIFPFAYKIYNLWFDEYTKDLPDHKFIYLESSPSIIISRITKRNQLNENKIKIDYLLRYHQYHKQFFNDNNKLLFKINMDNYDLINKKNKYKELVDDIINAITNNREIKLNMNTKKNYFDEAHIAYIILGFYLLIISIFLLY